MALTKNAAKKWEGSVGSITAAGNYSTELQTAGTYVDANIIVKANVAAGALSDATGGAVTATVGLTDTTYLTTDSSAGYGPITATADASRTAVTVGVGTAGWIPTTASKTSAAASATQDSVTKYVKKGALKSNSGSANATGNGVTLGTKTTTQPTSGKYITVTGSGSVGVQTAGWLTTDDSKSSNTATAYYPVTGATLNNTATSGQSYTEIDGATNNNVIIPSGGYLYINGGYIDNTKISLATLVPDGATIAETATGKSDKMRGISAYDKDGKLIAGSMPDAVLSTSGSISAVSIGTKSGTSYPVSVTGSTSADTTTTGYAIAGTTKASGSISSTATLAAIGLNASGSITAATPSYNSTSGKFDLGVTGTASAGVATAGYGKAGVESASANITSSATLNKVTVAASKGTDGKVTPVISNKVAAVSGKTQITATPTTATTGIDTYYMAVESAAISASTTVTPSVSAAGYGDTTNFTSAGNVTVTRGANGSGTYYIPLKTAELTHENTATEQKVAVSASGARSSNLADPGTDTTYYVTVNASQTGAGSVVHSASVSEGYVPTAGLSQNATIATSASITGNGTKVYLKSTKITGSMTSSITSGYDNSGVLTSAPTDSPYLTLTGNGSATTGAVYNGTATAANKYIKVYDGGIVS